MLHQYRDVAILLLEYPVTLDYVRRVRSPENLHLPEDLTPHRRVAVAVHDLESVHGAGVPVPDLVNGSAVAVAEDLELVEVGGGDGGSGDRGSGGGRDGGREAGAALRQGEGEVRASAVFD